MFQNAKARQKMLEKAAAVLGAGHRALDIGRGGAGSFRPDVAGYVVGGLAVALVIVIALATGVIIGGGAIPIAIGVATWYALAKPVAVVLTDQRLALMAKGAWTNKPKTVLGWIDLPGAQSAPVDGKYRKVLVAGADAWIREDDLVRLAQVASSQGPPPVQ